MLTIQPYPMPTAADLAPGPAGWRPDPRRAALLIHDMQGYFVSFLPSGASPTTELLANIAALRAAGLPVIYSAQPGRMSRADRGLLHDVWGPGMTDDPANRDIVDALAPGPDDLVLTKWRYSAFHRTRLAEHLAETGRDQLVVCGVYAHLGCLLTACDAYAHDIQPFLVADAVAAFSAADHRLALDYAASACAVTLTTAQVLSSLGV
ncbi:isochorismatase family protein [Dactylosporangium sp. AC04546]|uniref:isochorismatase family protein n=1 Tax=Dactylosporangium sp. AC04546 TaxID=2862460 RepID=UPI001EDECA3D|nr:isochorismatase family protein [Dactylosporangium sp. AC04546]WVK87492.1 isochorismatase family protein [Dactylosporangium sp. AC04546]